MTAGNLLHQQPLLDALEDFREAPDMDGLWRRLHSHLADSGIGCVMYGNRTFVHAGGPMTVFLCSFNDAYLRDKLPNGLLDADHYVQSVQTETAPILWSDAMRLRNVPPLTLRSLAVDWEHGVLTGVSLPLRFNRGFGVGGFGLHAPSMTWNEFERIWGERKLFIQTLCHAFDVLLREAHSREIFALAPRERDCLLYLASGLRPQQIAHQFGTHVKTVEKQIEGVRRKLKAATNGQAVATALVFGLIAP